MAENFTTNNTGITLFNQAEVSASSLLIGYIALIISAIFFGSNLVPIKKIEPGDGKKIKQELILARFEIFYVI